MCFSILQADLENPQHGEAIIVLLDMYARDPMGGGEPLSDFVRDNLPAALRSRQDVMVLLAYQGVEAVGILIAFEGFSTFRCKPLMNIHDVAVLPEYRSRGVAKQLFAEIERVARAKECCKLTLEVLEGNKTAQAAYRSLGFEGYELDPKAGKAMFWEKILTN